MSDEATAVKMTENTDLKSIDDQLVQNSSTSIDSKIETDPEEITPTNSKVNLDQFCSDVPDVTNKTYRSSGKHCM